MVGVVRRTLALSMHAVDAAFANLMLLDEQGRPALALNLLEGKFRRTNIAFARRELQEGLSKPVVETRQAVMVANVDNDPRWLPAEQERWNEYVRAVICAPLVRHQRVVGVLTCTHPQANHFDQDDLETLESVASQAAVAVENARLFAAEEQRRHLANTLQDIARTLTATLELDAVLSLILEYLERMLPYNSAYIFLLRDNQLNARAHRGADTVDPLEAESIDLESDALLTKVISGREPFVCDDIAEETGSERIPILPTAHGWAGAPLVARGEIVGVLILESEEVGTYIEADTRIIAAFADSAAVAIANARLISQIQQRLDEVGFLHRTGRTITASLDLEDVLGSLLESVRAHFQVEAASVLLLDEETGELVFRVASGMAAEALVGRRLEAGQGIAGWVAATGQPALIPSTRHDSRHYRELEQEIGYRADSILAAPIQIGNRTIGVIEAINPPEALVTENNLVLLVNVAILAASAIQNARHFTHARDAEQRFSSLFENSADPIMITDAAGVIVDVNLKMCEMLKHSEDELIGKEIASFHSDPGSTRRQLAEALEGESIFYNIEALTSDGASIPFEVRATLVSHHSRPYVQWVCHDLTERLQLERARRDITNMIIHDLRNPLASIMSSLELIRTAVIDETVNIPLENLFSVGKRSGDRLYLLINSILDMARLEEGEEVDHSSVDVRGIVLEVIDQVRLQASTEDIDIQGQVPDELPRLWGDPDLLQRVLQNLLDNALKFTPRGGEIRVEVSTEDEDGLMFAVSDTGPGIPPERHELIFDRFYSASDGSRRGTGLGLALCKLVVEAHGGRIWVESEVGEGAIFKFVLPLGGEVE
jgi:PAS domain S-box-containing protein